MDLFYVGRLQLFSIKGWGKLSIDLMQISVRGAWIQLKQLLHALHVPTRNEVRPKEFKSGIWLLL